MKYLVQQKGFIAEYDSWKGKRSQIQRRRETLKEEAIRKVYGKDIVWIR